MDARTLASSHYITKRSVCVLQTILASRNLYVNRRWHRCPSEKAPLSKQSTVALHCHRRRSEVENKPREMGIMPSHRSRSVGTAAVLLCVVILVSTTGSTEAQLQTGFYSKSCPKAEDIIRRFVGQHIPNAPSLAATLLRMHFHDCFVRVGTFPAVSFVGGLFLVQISDEKFVSSGLRCVGSPELDFEHPGGEDGHSEPNPQGF